MLRGVTVRLDLMGEGIALWPMYVPLIPYQGAICID
jgi:hypothetical protein